MSDIEGTDGGGGELDLGSLLGQAQKMQEQMVQARSAAASAVVEGQAGGGVVRIEATGGLEFSSVTIDPTAVDPADVEMLQDLILAALNDVVARANEAQSGAMGGLDLGGMDLGGMDLGGLLGGD
jgi:DNA-binding YbaB/EbfC family protein